MGNRPQKVLIVDDEPLNLDVLESYLADTGVAVTRALSGEEAVKLAEDTPPDLVLLDIMMPGMDGLEVCRRLKESEKTRFVPVVMVTSLDAKSDRIAAVKAGADDFITKPVDKAELSARVATALRMKALHDSLEDSYRELAELQVLKDNMMNMLVHDFRNPLTGIMGYLELIEGQFKTSKCENCRQYVHNSAYLAKKMSFMVNDIMDVSRLEKNVLPLKLEDVHIRDAVENSIREFAHAIEQKNIRAVIEESGEGVYVEADRTLLTRTIGNLLANAVRYSPEGGMILFDIGATDDTAVLSISDEGPGVPDGKLPRIFEKFYQVEAKSSDARSGAGLGLAFCDLVVKAHGGGITVGNNPGRGCRFTIRLPLFR